MIHLYTKDKVKLAGLIDYKNLVIEHSLESGDKTLSFSYPKSSENYFDIQEEGYIRTKENEYVIKEKNVQNDYTDFKCNLNLEDLEGKPFERFNSKEQSIDKALSLALAGTGWIVGSCSLQKKRTVRMSNCSSLEVIKEIKKTYRCDLVFNTLSRTIDVYEHLGEDKGAYFIDSLNLKTLGIQGNSYDYYTRIIPIGKDNLRITDINNGKEYVENYQYSSKVKTIYWKDDRYTIVENLKEDAEAKLNEISKPYRSYSAEILNLAKLNDKYKNILDFKLGDTITLISKEDKFKDKQRIVKVIEHPDEPELDSVELSNTTLSFEDIQTQFQDAADTVDNITSDNGTIDGSTINEIETNQIKDFYKEVIEATNINAINAKIFNLEAHNVTISGQLTSVNAQIGSLTTNVATIDKLVVKHDASITDLNANKASITQLEAANAIIQVLEATVGKIETLVNGNLSSENIQAGGITSDKLTIANGFITNAMIMNLDVSKVNAGDISTNKFRIKSDDGGIEIAGATQQFKDKNNRVRIQMGQDAKGDFNFIIRGEDGQSVLIDHTGIKQDAIADDLIKSNMISSNAVGEKQIDYSSFSEGFNKETNTHTLKATKIKLDNQNQTLDLAFNSLKTEVQGIQIGGRNLALNTDFFIEGEGYKNFDLNLDTVKTFRGKQITISLDIALVNAGASNNAGGRRVGSEISISFSDGTTIYVGVWESLSESLKNINKRISRTWTIPDKEIVDFGQRGVYIQGTILGKVKAGKTKIELGNKDTDWTPAPEDVEGEIESVKKITTSQSTTIGVIQGQISTAINNTQIIKDGQTILLKDDYNRTVQTVNSMSSTIGKHTTTINQHTGEITGVTSRVNVVERDLNGIKARVSSTETDLYNTKSKVATIEIDLNKVTTRVSATETTTANISDISRVRQGTVLNKDTTFAEGLNQVNLYNNSNNGNVTLNRIPRIEGCPTNSTHCIEIKHTGLAAPGLGGFYFGNPTRANAIIAIRFIAKIPVGCKLGFATNSTGTGTELKWLTTDEGTGNWEEYIHMVKCGSSGSFSSTNFIYLRYGDHAPTPSNPVVWYVAEATGIDASSGDNIEKRISTAEQKITKSAIISTVSSQFYTKGQSDGMYATQSEFKQLSTGFEFQIQNTGRPQLIPNGDFRNSWNFWKVWNSKKTLEFISSTETYILRVEPTQTSGHVSFGMQVPAFPMETNKTYTLAFWVESPNIKELNYNFIMSNDIGAYRLGNVSFDTKDGIMTRVSITFVAKSTTTMNIMLGWEGEYQPGLFFHIKEACCFEGTVAYPYKPCNDEIYAGITYVDQTGIGVKHMDGSTSKMTADSVVFTNVQQQKKMAIKKGALYAYDVNNGDLLGMFASNKVTSTYRGVTTGLTGSAHYYAIGATKELTDDDQLTMTPYILIAQQDLHNFLGNSVISGGINFMNTPCIFHQSPLFNVSPRFTGGFAILKNDGSPLNIYHAKNSIYIESNVTLPTGGSFYGGGLYGGDITSIGYNLNGRYTDVIKLYANIQQVDFLRPLNMNGFGIYNATLAASYSLAATSPGRSVGADTASVETMLLQEDFSKFDEENNAVVVDMNEAVKFIYAKNKNLENENEELKNENKNLNKELETTKNALDEILMNV